MTLKSDSKKRSFLRNMNFLCDAIDLKQSVERTLEAWGKSLTIVWHEAHFIVNLYSLPLPLVPEANPSFTMVSHLTPPRWNNFQNFPSIFLLTVRF